MKQNRRSFFGAILGASTVAAAAPKLADGGSVPEGKPYIVGSGAREQLVDVTDLRGGNVHHFTIYSSSLPDISEKLHDLLRRNPTWMPNGRQL